jgi:dipeptidyl aminopeptidase/acylaminoacyl peptidase
MKKWLLVGLIVLAFLLVGAYFAGGFLVYNQMTDVETSCDNHWANLPDAYTNLSDWPEFDMSPYFMPEYEDVRFPARQTGYEIAGWYVAGDPEMPAVVVLDGIGGCRRAQAALVPAGMLWRNGFNVLIIDLHETGDSQIVDGHSTMGADEYLDVLGAWDWLVAEKGFDPTAVGIAANSLGAATSLYAFAEEPRAPALFLNSPYANLPQILQSELRRGGFPPQLVPAAIVMGRAIAGVNVLERTPLEAIAQVGNRPVFVVHSSDDLRVDIDHSYQLQAAADAARVPAEFWFIDGADHVRGPAVYPEEFEAKLVSFFRQTLGPESQ